MKAKSRRRLLISSVAMLLVAMLALGTATFAWFTSNPNANASGLKLKTTASTGLVIRTETDTRWTHNAILRATGSGDATVTNSSALNLTPVSQEQDNPANFWTVGANDAGQYTPVTYNAEDNTTKMTGATAGTDYYAEKVYFRLSDGSDASAATSQEVQITGITINAAENATMQNAIRVAIADKDGALLGNWAIATTGAHGTLTGEAQTAGTFEPALTAVGTGLTGLTIGTNQTGLSASGDDLSKYVTVYVYLDGQDTDCYSDKVGTVNATEIISGVSIDFKLV